MRLPRLSRLPPPLPLHWVLTVPLVLFTLLALVVDYPCSEQGSGRVSQILLLSLFTLGGAIALGALLTQGLLARLRLFARVSSELAAGNLAQRLPTDSRISEFNHLACSFNQMADQLQQSFQRMQTTLAEAETKFITIFRTSPDPMAIATREEGRLLDVNHSLLEFFGYDRAEMVGRTAIELNLWADLSQRDRYRALLEQQGRVRNLEIQIKTKEGEVKTVLLSAEAQALDGQDCLIITHRDITDRHRAEAALRQSQQQLALAQRVAQVGYWEFDVASQGITWSEMTFRNWGLEPTSAFPTYDELLQKLPPADRDRLTQCMATAIAEGLPYQVDLRPIHPDGSIHYLDARGEPIFDDQGRVVKLVGVSMDITDRKRTEEALRQSEARFRSAFDNAPYGISLVTTTGQFVLVNAYYCTLLGYTESELLALTFKDITHPDDWADDWAGFQRMMSGAARTYEIEKRYLSKQGEVIPVVINAAPIYDGAGNPIYSVGHVQDIRDRLAINRMKDEFISVVSHELRTPITAIQGALALLGAGVYANRPEKARRMLDIAISNSDRLVRLVDDILSFERLESGKVQLEKEVCQVATLMYQAIDSVQPLADHSGITIALMPLNLTLWAAPDALIQVLTNLLSNAIKFSRPRETVWVKAEAVESDGVGEWESDGVLDRATPSPPTPHLLLTVRDRGRGIPAEKLEVIFDQFQQVDTSNSRQRGGTGLGLAICKRIVQQHQGRIWAESQLGQGSTFFVQLPLMQEVNHD